MSVILTADFGVAMINTVILRTVAVRDKTVVLSDKSTAGEITRDEFLKITVFRLIW